ncbi:hypothetical protein EZS27_001669 [termite gut metagenome]|uniref:Uncharacterized protein n=1 Tax=termite gut metagenome TaxID=433724 RepID=A0A5J4SZ52_9ZZZZ
MSNCYFGYSSTSKLLLSVPILILTYPWIIPIPPKGIVNNQGTKGRVLFRFFSEILRIGKSLILFNVSV